MRLWAHRGSGKGELENTLKGFEIAGNDQKFYPAKAEIKKNKIFFNLGLNHKTMGFMPASPSLNKDSRINFGLIISSYK